MGNKRVKSQARNDLFVAVLPYLVLIIFAVFAFIPVLWGLATSLKPSAEISSFPPTLWASKLEMTSYSKVLFQSNFPTYFTNSIMVTLICVATSIIVSAHAAYALARLNIPFRSGLMFAVLMTSMIPVVALLIPLYQLTVRIGIYNTRILIILIYTAWRTPILIWILFGFFNNTPKEIEEAAWVDGYSKGKIFYFVVLPISQPGIISAALLSAVYVWNDFLIAFTFTTKEHIRMISVGLYNYISQYGIQWGELMAAVMISIIPIIFLFVPLQKKFVSGLASGAVKG
jgi:ABC-type glycerol-3-phosphate transport system permease component